MDSSEAAAVDDQGSGWFEVRKKHRSSSEFSIQNWVGGFSRQQVNGKGGNSNGKPHSHNSRPGIDFVQAVPASHSSASKENKKDDSCLDKCLVDDDIGRLKIPPSKALLTTNSKSSSMRNEYVSQKKLDIVPKIRWGDLQDDSRAPDRGSSVVSGIKFGKIGDDDLAMCGTSRSLYDLGACNSCQDDRALNKELVVDAACNACHKGKSSPIDGFLEEHCKQVSEVASSYVEIVATTGTSVNAKSSDMEREDSANEDVAPLNKESLCATSPSEDGFPCSSAEEDAKVGDISSPVLSIDVDVMALSVVPSDDGHVSPVVNAHDLELAQSDGMVEDSGNLNATTVVSCGDLPNGTSKNDLPNGPSRVIGELEEGESKERFRERLWCFLFENLNRAIDELYLLCELECDLEQVKEAIVVLQEAQSDFRELNRRVEEFEKMKNNSSLSANGALMSIKGDHRRPHALSWEVRRMTTSPHRAEILSSSLEAFKKIQEERAKDRAAFDVTTMGPQRHSRLPVTIGNHNRSVICDTSESETKTRRQCGISDVAPVNVSKERSSTEPGKNGKVSMVHDNRVPPPASNPNTTKLPPKVSTSVSLGGKGRKEKLGPSAEVEKHSNSGEQLKRHSATFDKEKEKDKRNSISWKHVDAWKEKRNWEEILASPCRVSSRMSYSPFMSRRSAERARILHDKLMIPEKKKKTAIDLKKEAEEKHARAMRIRSELENERVQKLQRTSEKLSRVSEWHAVRSMKLREGMYARHQRSESRHEAYIAQVVKRAGDESIKVNEVRFITSLNEENKKFWLRQKLHDSEMRRAEKFQVMKTKQKEDLAREEAVMERRKLIEAEKLQRLAETQRRKEEAQLRREEERKASSAAREARAMEQLRRKEERAKAQQEEAELLAQRLVERLSESEQRRKVYLEQIRERASMDFRDQSSPLMRRSVNKEGQGRSTPTGNSDDNQATDSSGPRNVGSANSGAGIQQSLKRRVKRIRQRLMALKHELHETSAENVGIGHRTAMATARAKIGRWVQDLQRLRQARKEGAASIGLIAAEMIKFLEGKELELHASRQAGLLDFISSALPASHISKPEACQVTIYLLKVLKVVLFVPANRIYFLAQNLLPPLIPMLSAALESYIKIAASLNSPGGSTLQPSKTLSENFNSISEVLDGFLWTVTTIIGLTSGDERQLQMQDGLLELVVSYQIVHRLRDLFSLYDRPQVEGTPFPSSILLSINLLVVLTSKPRSLSSIDWHCVPAMAMPENLEVSNTAENLNSGGPLSSDSHEVQLSSTAVNCGFPGLSGVYEEEQCDESCRTKSLGSSIYSGAESGKQHVESLDSQKQLDLQIPKFNISEKYEKISANTDRERKEDEHISVKQPHAFLLSAISETGLVSVPSLLTAVLLQANNRLSSEQGSYVLPLNFEEVATGVLKVLNNLALMDITFMQKMLAKPDLKMEFFHIMSFLLTHCTNNWKVASDQVGLLLLESLLLLGYFSLFHPGNQAVLRWGNSPTILHKVCDLPFAFFSDPELMPILAGTLVAACFGCEQNKGVVQQELSTEMILSLVKSRNSSLPAVRSRSPLGNPPTEDSTENPSLTVESQRTQTDVSVKSTRSTARSSRLSLAKGSGLGNSSSRPIKLRNPRDSKTSKFPEDTTSKQKVAASDAPTLPLYSRFPRSFINRAEQFFSIEPNNAGDETRALVQVCND